MEAKTEAKEKLRVAAVGDLHCREDDHGRFRHLVRQVNQEADLLLLCGDLTDRGLEAEAKVLAEQLSELRVPCAAVLGNHDLDANLAKTVIAELAKAGVRVLDGDHWVAHKVLGIAGVKGFGGGYHHTTLQAFGEPQTKAYVQEGVNEALKLETALSQLDTRKKVVLTHYAPIAETTEGENPEIRPFLGTSRLMFSIDRFGVQAAFHGHAHHGTLEGVTERGVPVFNVSYPLLKAANPEHRFRVVEV